MTASSFNSLRSVTAAYHFWKSTDEIELALVSRNQGALSAANVKSIGRAYSVTRTLPKTCEEVAISINQLHQRTLDGGLVKIAEACVETAKEIHSDRQPRSAVSKLLWFVRPKGWTMYDRFATIGLDVKSDDGEQQFRDFYSRLEKQGFGELVTSFRSRLAKFRLPELLAERVVDWELMRRGGLPSFHSASDWTECALQTFGEQVSSALRSFAHEVADDLANFNGARN